ncbi:hypothetical protein V501_02660 [Pseudogymnoascus sp. VKM F-4519 (FW-2642)]|nr:hypothetical protein V501_02660 [Pseudogymnoascus sp. VKM F-4519 (FW-2642)]
MDLSMRYIALTPEDWITLHALQNFFYIFVKPSQKLQASLYPTLNFAIPQYLKMIKKLEALQNEVEEQRDAEANLLQLPQEPDSDDDLYISHSIYQEPEWKRWLVEPRPGPATDILKYWAAKQYQYPIIAAIARDHLAIPATSAPSERVFSNGANILTKKRNRLSPETLRYLLCLRDWGHILDTEESEAEDADGEREEELDILLYYSINI